MNPKTDMQAINLARHTDLYTAKGTASTIYRLAQAYSRRRTFHRFHTIDTLIERLKDSAPGVIEWSILHGASLALLGLLQASNRD